MDCAPRQQAADSGCTLTFAVPSVVPVKMASYHGSSHLGMQKFPGTGRPRVAGRYCSGAPCKGQDGALLPPHTLVMQGKGTPDRMLRMVPCIQGGADGPGRMNE